LLLRLDGLGSRSMSHPELFVPGIDLPEDISAPPPLLSLPQAMWWHFHTEVHPQGYYFFMWGWTKLFGTSLSALRLPSVILGTLSLILVFCLASQVFDRWTGLIGMALLAFNGHHLYWSQMARMYSMLCFLGLLSTLLLVGGLIPGGLDRDLFLAFSRDADTMGGSLYKRGRQQDVSDHIASSPGCDSGRAHVGSGNLRFAGLSSSSESVADFS
jgi:hypothetical protein